MTLTAKKRGWGILSKAILIALFYSVTVFSADNLPASFDPPGGLEVDSCPLFIVLGFDDNRYVDGMEWTLDLLDQYKNPVGTGNSKTFDGQSIKASFYHTSGALDDPTHGGAPLLATWKRALEGGHEVADHTVTHNTTKNYTLEQWTQEIRDCRTKLAEVLEIDESEIKGFRTPYLDFGEATFQAVADLGLLYECTMTQMQDYNKSMFVWPYTLDNGFPDKTISGWKDKGVHPGLWELPVYTVGENDLMWPPITGFDSSVLTQANGSKYELMLKNAIEYRLKEGGNRAPLTVGLHTDTYAEANPAGVNYDAALNLEQRREALKNFIEYALTKPEVRFVTGVQLIEWMRNPVPLGRTDVSVITQKSSLKPVLLNQQGDRIFLENCNDRKVTVSLLTPAGRIISENTRELHNNTLSFSFPSVAAGAYILMIQGQTTQLKRSIFLN